VESDGGDRADHGQATCPPLTPWTIPDPLTCRCRSSFITQFMEAPSGENYPNHTYLSRLTPNFFPVSG
jgi:hypothetical protein